MIVYSVYSKSCIVACEKKLTFLLEIPIMMGLKRNVIAQAVLVDQVHDSGFSAHTSLSIIPPNYRKPGNHSGWRIIRLIHSER